MFAAPCHAASKPHCREHCSDNFLQKLESPRSTAFTPLQLPKRQRFRYFKRLVLRTVKRAEARAPPPCPILVVLVLVLVLEN
jgi:hypothetical protein